MSRQHYSLLAVDELLTYGSDRQALTAGKATLRKEEGDFLIAWAGRLETRFWSLVPLEKRPAGMRYAGVDPVSGLSMPQRRPGLRIEHEEDCTCRSARLSQVTRWR